MNNYILYCTHQELLALRNCLFDSKLIPEIEDVLSQINYYLEGDIDD